VENDDATGVIARMPLKIEVAPRLTKTFDISVNLGVEYISNTHIRGPKDVVDALVQDPGAAKAVLEIDDVNDKSPKQLVFHLPPGVTVDKEDQDRTYDFTLTTR
jgi:hypothetical protein